MDHDMNRRKLLKSGIAAGTGLLLSSSWVLADPQSDDLVTEELSLFDTIRKRRSVRKFKSTPIPKKHLNKILEAACLAPTAGNQQPWKFLVVDDRTKIDELKANCINYRLKHFQDNESPNEEQLTLKKEQLDRQFTDYLSAPVYVVVLTSSKSEYPDYNHWDGPLAAGYLLLAARALGYGTVFCTDTIPEEVTRETFNIPDHLTRVCITPIGVPERWPSSPGKKPWRYFVKKNTF